MRSMGSFNTSTTREVRCTQQSMFNKRGGGEVGVTTVGADRDSPRLGRGTRHGPRRALCKGFFSQRCRISN